MFRRTKIGATLGPACADYATIHKMVKAGMDFARLNFSHGTHSEHARLVKNIRKAEKKIGVPVAIMQDLRGPKIRIGILPKSGIEIKAKSKIVLNTEITEYAGKDLPLFFPRLPKYLKAGERVLIDDGRIELNIKKISGVKIICETVQGGIIFSNKGVNFPDSKLLLPTVSQKDKDDLKFGLKMGVDVIALSFVHTAKDILDLRKMIEELEKELKIKSAQPVSIIAKIERHEAVDNIEEILSAADGLMVARGDLGLEMPAAEVPLIQKKLIDIANSAAKPVIVATQMLDSMQHNRRPTRAEVSDVANAVIDHTDAVLLTNETATGDYPILTVATMNDVITTAEQSKYDDVPLPAPRRDGTAIGEAITEVSRLLAEEVNAKLILAASISGETGRLISRVRAELPILVATATVRAQRQLNLSWGIQPFVLLPCKTFEELVRKSIDYIRKNKIAKKGEKMLLIAGEPVGQAGNVNLVEVREIK